VAARAQSQIGGEELWDDLLAIRDEQRVQIRTGIQVIKEAELPLETNRQGMMRWYMHPSIKDTALSTMIFFQQEIPPGSRSGRIKFQGGQVILILEGKGYTLIDGVKHMEAGECSTCRCARAASSCSTSTPIPMSP
jgi:hypothetical protein